MLDLPVPPSTILYGFLTLLAVWYGVSTFVSWYRLRHIPGPFLASFSYLWIVHNAITGRTGDALSKLGRYGRLVRTGPNYVQTDDPEILRQIASVRANYARDKWWHGTKGATGTDTMTTLLDPAAHDAYKAKAMHGYSGRGNDIEKLIDGQVLRLVDHVRRRRLSSRDGTRMVDFAPISRYFTFDVITRLAYGREFGFLGDADRDDFGLIESIDRFASVGTIASDWPLMRFLVSTGIAKRYIPSPTDTQGLGKVLGMAQDIVKRRYQEEKSDENDVIGSFMRNGMTSEESLGETLLLLFAGSDTTATAIRGTLMYTMSTPRVYHHLKATVKDAVASGSVDCPITVQQAKEIPYLQALIYEGYRMRSPAIYGHYKVVPTGGVTFKGVYIPGGTAIGNNFAALVRRPDIFGDDVDTFRPERWIECGKEKRMEMERAIDITFGGGRWTCAGKNIAWTELNKVFFELFRNFDFQLVYPGHGWDESSALVWLHKRMWVRITEAE